MTELAIIRSGHGEPAGSRVAHEGCLPAGPPCAGAVWPWLFRDPVGSGLWWNRHLAACGGLSDQRRMEASEPLGWRREELAAGGQGRHGGRSIWAAPPRHWGLATRLDFQASCSPGLSWRASSSCPCSVSDRGIPEAARPPGDAQLKPSVAQMQF